MTTPPGKRMLPMYIDKAIFREIKIYAVETETTMQDVIKPISDEFTQYVIKLVTQIREMKRQAEAKRLREEEEARIAAEAPLQVSGHEEEPIGTILVEQ